MNKRSARSSQLRALYQISAIIVVISLCGFSIIARYRSHSLFSLDGAFQTYGMVSAIDRGLDIGSDFFPYLGPLVGYILYPFFKLFGSTLFASTAAAELLSVASFTLALWVLATLVGATGYGRGLVLLCGGALIIFNRVTAANALLQQYTPGNSLRGVRWMLPYLSIALLLCAHSYFTRRLSGSHARKALAAIWGALIGFQVYWSPDVGLVSAATLMAAWVLFDDKRPCLPCVGRFTLLVAFAAVTAFLVGSYLTNRNLVGWFGYVFGGLPEDQFWYFGAWDAASRVLSFTDLVRNLLPGVYSVLIVPTLIMAIIVAARLGASQPERLKRALLVYAAVTFAGASLIPQVAGHVDNGYATPIVLPFAFLLYLLRRDLALVFRPSGVARILSAINIAKQHIDGFAMGLVTWSPMVLVALGSLGLGLIMAAMPFGQTIYVPELGAHVNASIQPELDVMRRFAREADAAGIAPDARTFSMYTSSVDLVAGAVPPSPYGMLIHALGNKARHQHLAVFRERTYPLVTTINPKYSAWANWNLRAGWYLFRDLFGRYRPLAKSNQHVYWVPRDTPLPPREQLSCTVQPEADNRRTLSIEGDASWAHRDAVVVEVDLALSLKLMPSLFPIAGNRALLTAVERQSALRPQEGVTPPKLYRKASKLHSNATKRAAGAIPPERRYGIGMHGGNFTLAAEHDPAHPTIIALESLPADRTVLNFDTCRAWAVAPAIDLKSVPPLTSEVRIPVAGGADQ